MYNYYYALAQMNKPQSDDDSLSSNVFGEIPLSVKLVVQFEIAK